VTDKLVIITGAASGIGRSVASVVLDRQPGVHVGLIDLAHDALHEVAAVFGDRATAVACDVSDQSSFGAAVSELADGHRLVGFVNAAGIHRAGASIDLSAEAWHEVLAVHVDGSFFGSQAAARIMVDTGERGSIVNFGSVAMDFGWPGRLAYAVSKAAIGGLTRTLGVEWADKGIRVNAVAPGYVNTPMIQTAVAEGIIDGEERRAGHAMKRFAEPDEIGEVVEFLLSDRSSFMTGEVVRVDGGFSVTK
jgi:NAD(P)-dependent dehydrogenase (short-subunit alcohol dehydrogenase family)